MLFQKRFYLERACACRFVTEHLHIIKPIINVIAIKIAQEFAMLV